MSLSETISRKWFSRQTVRQSRFPMEVNPRIDITPRLVIFVTKAASAIFIFVGLARCSPRLQLKLLQSLRRCALAVDVCFISIFRIIGALTQGRRTSDQCE